MAESITIAGVEVSKPDKVLFPDDGVTKADLASYYADVAEVMLPHVAGRVISMQRFPDGIAGQGFYEKKAPDHFPDWFERVDVATSGGSQQQLVIGEERSLAYLADQACITPHVWLSHRSHLDRPDQLVFDLDPSEEDLDAVRAATRAVRDLLEELGMVSWVKTTGSRGFHVHTTLDGSASFDTARRFARDVADTVAARDPDHMTTEQRKDKRGSRVFVDVLRNAYGQTAVPPYAVRARRGAPVSTPIEWSELGRVTPDHYTLTSLPRRLAQRDDPWQDMAARPQVLDEPGKRLRDLRDEG